MCWRTVSVEHPRYLAMTATASFGFSGSGPHSSPQNGQHRADQQRFDRMGADHAEAPARNQLQSALRTIRSEERQSD
jgi:hypothetical protein